MTAGFLALAQGDRLPRIPVTVGQSDVRDYLAATGEPPDQWRTAVPPLALGAFVLAALMGALEPPSGIVHSGQQFDFLAAVPPGRALEAEISVARRAERRGTLITTLAIELFDEERVVLRGRASVVLALEASS